MSLQKKEAVPRAKAQALCREPVDPALGKGAILGPTCQLCADSRVTGSWHRSRAHIWQGPPDAPPVPRAAHRLSADLPSVPRAFFMTLGTEVGPAIHAVSCEWACDES
jgi:hypothetical protein